MSVCSSNIIYLTCEPKQERKEGGTGNAITSVLYLSDAHVHNHGAWCIVSFNQCGEVTAEDLLDAPQVRLAVAGHQLGALLMNVESTVCKEVIGQGSGGNHSSAPDKQALLEVTHVLYA